MMATNKLTGLQQKWLDAYLQCFNATEAARRAGYSGNDNVLAQRGYELVRNSKIKEEIERFFDANSMPAKEVVWRLTSQARADIGEFAALQTSDDLTNHPKSYLVKKMRRHARRNKDGTITARIEIELYDAQSALQLIGKHHGLFKDKTEHSGEITVNDGLTDEERSARIATLLDAARTRRNRQSDSGD